MSESPKRPGSGCFLLLLLGAAAAVYTQCSHLLDVPGLHFDEAWQGLFSSRIASEPGFWPLEAMNAYTAAIVHYPLALWFKVFSPSLLAMRSFYAVLNLSALALVLRCFLRARLAVPAVFFAWIWALLPLFVHIHRFYIEMTGFFALCAAVSIWAAQNWDARPRLAPSLLLASLALGTLSHLLFIALPLAFFFIAARENAGALGKARAQAVTLAYAALLFALSIKIHLSMGKKAPLGLAALALCVFGLVSLNKTALLARMARSFEPLLLFATIPFALMFCFLFWNGPWPYAQATGSLKWWWAPVNALPLLFLSARQLGRLRFKRLTGENDRTPQDRAWRAFAVSLLVCNAIIYKPAPRYFTIPALFCAMGLSLAAPAFLKRKTAAPILLFLVLFNFRSFEKDYIRQFQERPGTDSEFRLGFFHDSARDFRPFQKVFRWASDRGCQNALDEVEDDRFGVPLQFLKRTAPQGSKACPWAENRLLFSHVPNPNRGLRILAHEKEWGDLAIFMKGVP